MHSSDNTHTVFCLQNIVTSGKHKQIHGDKKQKMISNSSTKSLNLI